MRACVFVHVVHMRVMVYYCVGVYMYFCYIPFSVAHRPPSIVHLLQTAKLSRHGSNDEKMETSLYERGGQLVCSQPNNTYIVPCHFFIGTCRILVTYHCCVMTSLLGRITTHLLYNMDT